MQHPPSFKHRAPQLALRGFTTSERYQAQHRHQHYDAVNGSHAVFWRVPDINTTKVLAIIRASGPVSVQDIAATLSLSEKAVRSAIDRLRDQGIHIWSDTEHKGFWWSDDTSPTDEMYVRWKRPFISRRTLSLSIIDSPTAPCSAPASETAFASSTTSTAKRSEYVQLVKLRKSCDRCQGLTNVSAFPEYDSDQIGPWTRWQGNLDADLMVIGQDWADVSKLQENKGRPLSRFITNQNLVTLMEAVGITIKPPQTDDTIGKAFFTNAVLCLKPDMQTKVRTDWLQGCSFFLKRTVQIVGPKVVVAVGGKAWASLQRTFERGSNPPLNAGLHPWEIWPGGPVAFGVYHPGGLGTAQRSLDEQKEDWRTIGEFLRR